MLGKKSRAKAAVQAPGDPQPPPKPAPPPCSTHEPTRQVVDEYVKVVGVENLAGTGIQVLDCALSVNEIKGLPAIPEDVCSVTERLQKLQQEKGEPLKFVEGQPAGRSSCFDQGSFEQFCSRPIPLVEPCPNGDNPAT